MIFLKNTRTFFLSNCIILLLLIQNTYSIEFEVITQAQWNEAFTTLENYPNRQYIEELIFQGYTGSSDTTDISRISILRDCVSLKKLYIRIRLAKNLQAGSLDQIYEAIKDLPNITYLYIYCQYTKQGNQDNFRKVLQNYTKLNYLYYNIYDNQITNFCDTLVGLENQTSLTTLELHFGADPVTDISCYATKFLPLVNLKTLSIGFKRCDVNNISYLSNAFDTLQKTTTLRIYGTYNPIPSFDMQESFLKMTALKTFTFELAPQFSDNIVWQNVTIVHPNIETMRYIVGPYIDNSNQLFDYLPKLKRAELRFDDYYRKSSHVHVINQLVNSPNLYYLWNYYYSIRDVVQNDLSIAGQGNIHAPIKDKITNFEFYDHYCYKKLDMDKFETEYNDVKMPNLNRIYITRDGVRNADNYVVPKFNHSKIETLYYRIYRKNYIKTKWSLHKNLWDNLSSLIRPQLQIHHSSLTNADMVGFGDFFKSLEGREFQEFYLNLNYNLFNSFENLQNTHSKFGVWGGLSSFYIHTNDFVNLNGMDNFFTSYLDPQKTNKIRFYAYSNEITDGSGLVPALAPFDQLDDLRVYIYKNQIQDLSQFQGLYDNKPLLKTIIFQIRENNIADQSVFSQITQPLSYKRGKSIVSYFQVDFDDPSRGTTTTFQNMETKGSYLAVQKYGFCLSDYYNARRFVLGTNVCAECINENCYSCSKNDRCDICRISTPPRELPLCTCPIGYYSALDYTCLQCGSKCISCENGNTCLTCVNSIPKRYSELCICPDKYYDDGINDQCQSCKEGCDTCNDGLSCNDCIDGYYKKGTQCVKCPIHFTKCELNPENPLEILSQQCSGSNRYYVLPYCNCIEGYYHIENVADCMPCNIKCTECTSSKKCQACAPKYYHDAEEESCNRCHQKCKTCTNSESCETCDDRQYDPATYCLQKYSAQGNNTNSGGNNTGGTNTNGQNGGSTDENNNNNNNNSNNGSDNNGNNNSNDGSSDGNQNQNGSDNGQNGNNGGTNNNGGQTDGNSNNQNPNGQNNNGNDDQNQVLAFSMFNPVTNQVEVLKCDFNCETCSEQNICSTCIVGLNRLQNPPLCSCQDGYHNNNGSTIDCQKCHSTCKQCKSQEECTACRDTDNREHSPYSMSCECKPGYKSIHNSVICEACFQYKDSCLIKCPQNTIQDQKSKTCLEINQSLDNSSNLPIFILCGLSLIAAILISFVIMNKNVLTQQNKYIEAKENCDDISKFMSKNQTFSKSQSSSDDYNSQKSSSNSNENKL